MSDTGSFTREESSMTEVRMIGIDPKKRSFHLHGVRANGRAFVSHVRPVAARAARLRKD